MYIVKKLLDKPPAIALPEKHYFNLVIILAPLINFLSGVAIDLYAPSLPAIASYFNTSSVLAKNTVTATLIGLAIGNFLCGLLFEVIGRKKIIVAALFFFTLLSLIAPHCHTIYELIVIRFLQGIATAAMSTGCRALVGDHFSGHQFMVAIIYCSIAYALGPIIGPFLGGYLQYHFNWQANFYAYVIISVLLLVLTTLFIEEKYIKLPSQTTVAVIKYYKIIYTHKIFLAGTFILGLLYMEQMLYPLIAPFIVEHELNKSAITYGNSTLIIGVCYLISTLINRLILRFFSQKQIFNLGFSLLALALLIQFLCAINFGLNLITLVLPISMLSFAMGFLFPNFVGNSIKLFPDKLGVAVSAQGFLVVAIGSLGLFIASYMTINSLYHLFCLYLLISLIQAFAYYSVFKKHVAI